MVGRCDMDGAIRVPVAIRIDDPGLRPMAAGGDGGPRRAAERTAQDRAFAPAQLGTHAGSQRAAERAAQYRIPC